MSILLFLLFVVVGFFGVAMFVSAGTAMQETTASIFLLMSVVLFTGAGIVEALNQVEKRLRKPVQSKGNKTDKDFDSAIVADGMKKCPNCNATIFKEAEKCRYCKHEM